MPKATKVAKFTDDEFKTIGSAAHRVWNNIAYDLFTTVEGVGDSVSRAEVMELVLDASRLEEELRHTKGVDKALVARVGEDIYGKKSEVEAYLKKHVFTYGRYGM